MKAIRRFLVSVVPVMALLFSNGPVFAFEPTKPIQLVVGYAAGGASDLVARALATASEGIFPVPLIVVNKPGASGSIAAEAVAAARPDGYTLMIAGGSETTAVPHFRKVTYSLGSFTPLVGYMRLRMLIVVPASSPIKSFQEYVTFAKANPGKVSFGTGGVGGLAQSVMLMINSKAGIQTTDIPFKGDSEIIVSLIAGQLDAAQIAPDQAAAYGERIRVLAVTSNDRFPGLPDVPTLKELGYDIYLENMKGVVGPAKMPPDVREYLSTRLRRVVESDAFRAAMKSGQYELAIMDGPTFGQAMSNMSTAIKDALPK